MSLESRVSGVDRLCEYSTLSIESIDDSDNRDLLVVSGKFVQSYLVNRIYGLVNGFSRLRRPWYCQPTALRILLRHVRQNSALVHKFGECYSVLFCPTTSKIQSFSNSVGGKTVCPVEARRSVLLPLSTCESSRTCSDHSCRFCEYSHLESMESIV